MMRSMYSAVSGLKTHQTKMDVIGNNIANVNTVAFKSSQVTFQDVLYQTTTGASGANVQTGVGGVNAKQIGLGVNMGATNISITTSGAAETTGRAFDIRLTDMATTNFFVVNTGTENLFTRSGSFYVDGAGNLAMTSTGYLVMGWQVDPQTGEIARDNVSPLRVMAPENLTSAPEATTNAIMSGIIDRNDPDVLSDNGMVKNVTFYDRLGYAYTARFTVKQVGAKDSGQFSVELASILDNEGNVYYDPANPTAGQPDLEDAFGAVGTATKVYEKSTAHQTTVFDGNVAIAQNGGVWEITTVAVPPGAAQKVPIKEAFAGISNDMLAKINPANPPTYDPATGNLTIPYDTIDYKLQFSQIDGTFDNINGADFVTLNMTQFGPNFENIQIDFTKTQNTNNGGKSTAVMTSGGIDGTTGKGRKIGALIGLSVDQSGKISGTYDNGNTELLGQIAAAQFANASGLEKRGENCYATTLNSGEFDGIGVDISADGSKMTSGELEMSNVDLSSEFTQMIVTQRGFQANSRVITVSDTLLEELVNLKR
ncbi:MAG: flagellar hook-basal body complex protein [Clostridiales bacterium]|nr:flagellar hook-basal body complex protein [Clostridiales bacterium]